MSVEDPKSGQLPKGDLGTDQGRPDLYKQKYGLKVLRQLTPEELGIQPTAVVTTEEGFNIHGTNENSFIRSLRSLNGISIRDLETRMRPAADAVMGIAGAQRGGISMSGFLGHDESLLEVLATDNDTVLGMGLTHQQLAEFLFYFDDVSRYLNRGMAEMPTAFEYGGRTYIHSAVSYRGIQESPFNDGTGTNQDHEIYCVEDGSAIGYSGLLPYMIHRYGFYEGQNVGYRLNPRELAEVAGFIPRVENDPVAALVKDPQAAVEITTSDQIWRLHNLWRVKVDRATSPNYRFVPSRIQDLLSIFRNFGRSVSERDSSTDPGQTRRQAVAGHIDLSHMDPQDLVIKRYGTHVLIENIIYDFPQFKQRVLDCIRSIDFPASADEFEKEYFVESLLKAISQKTPTGQDHPHKEYMGGLLSKIQLTPENLQLIYHAAAKIYDAGWRSYGPEGTKTAIISDSELTTLATAIDSTLPAFRRSLIALNQRLGIGGSENMTTADLIQSKERMDNYRKMIKSAIEFAQRVGGPKSISEVDMGQLIGILIANRQDPNYSYTEEDLAILSRTGVEPSLIPYAWRVVSGSVPPGDHLVAQLYNGAAKNERDLELLVDQLPVNMDKSAQEAARLIIKNALRAYSSDKIDVRQFTSRLNVLAADLQKKADAQQEGLATIREEDVLNEYFGLTLPPFKELFSSPLIRKSLQRDALGTMEVTLDPQELANIPEIEVTGSYGRTVRKVRIGGQEYEIDKYNIKTGDFSLRLSGNKVSTYLNKGRSF